MARSRSAGYRRPPEATKFKPGKSGNPKGRPKGSLNLGTVLADELGQRITIRENGTPQRVSKQGALVKALLAKALQGDIKAIATVLNLSAQIFADRSDEGEHRVPPAELKLLDDYARQILGQPDKRRRR